MRHIATEIIADELKLQLGPVPKHLRSTLLDATVQLVTRHVTSERSRCRSLRKRRADLWRNTKGRLSSLAEEARSRANEADYLGDLISTDLDVTS